MIALTSNITIGDYTFDFCNDVEINSSWENLTDTARIIMPKKLRFKKDGVYTDNITSGPDALWKRGQRVEINLGYDGNLDTRFIGVITGVRPKTPIEFACEDGMYILKQNTIKKYSVPKVSLPNLIKAILPEGIKFEAEDINLGKFIVNNASTVEVFDYLRKNFGLYARFQTDGVLYVGFPYKVTSLKDVTQDDLAEFNFERNIIDGSSLEYIRDDDTRLNVTAYNVKPDNTRTSINVGDSLGEKRTIYFYDVSAADLKRYAEEALEKYKYEGFKGSFTTFLQPYVRHGMAIKIVDPEIPDRNGTYLVKQVTTRFGMDGGRQDITLDRKIL